MISMPVLYPANVTFYNFTAIQPADGHCEWKQFGYRFHLAEPAACVFGLITALHGLFGLIKSERVSIGSRYMFSLLLGYGLASVGNTATLWNGFDRTGGCILNLMQAVIILRLISTMRFPPFNDKPLYGYLGLMSTFGLYPVIAHVIGSSFDNPWVSWLTFDLIWFAILAIVIVIFVYREKYPQFENHENVFTLVFNAMVTCILAYVFWLIDKFACSHLIASMNFYGIWLVLMGMTFYYLAILDAFLQSSWQGFDPVITRWPKKYIILFVQIKWEPKKSDMAGKKLN